ncbi:hypothetical protein H2203_008870 [Taxawa tesnikishii (nom. ined.)]|nr:hypothetical protein H2203_008870 [Dothideales sp. JES 119]
MQAVRVCTVQGTETTAQTASETTVDQAQSTDVVQTLLFGSLSCVAYLRGLFSEKCFDQQYFAESDGPLSYERYSTDTSPVHSSRKSKRGVGTTVLKKGRSRRVDELLEILVRLNRERQADRTEFFFSLQESGVFDALKLRVLRALQLSLLADPEKPSNVLETWTFNIRYGKTTTEGRPLQGLELHNSQGGMVQADAVRKELVSFIRKVLALCNTLPELPDRRFLTLTLFYVDDCDANYEPLGFVRNDDERYHRVGLRVSYVEDNAYSSRQMPATLRYAAPCSCQDDLDGTMEITESFQTSMRLMAELGDHNTTGESVGTTNNAGTVTPSPTAVQFERDIDRTPSTIVEGETDIRRETTEPAGATLDDDTAMTGISEEEGCKQPPSKAADPMQIDSMHGANVGALQRSSEDWTGQLQMEAAALQATGEDSQMTTVNKDNRVKEALQKMLLPEEFEDSLEETQPRFSGLERIEEESDDPLQTPMERDSASAATTYTRLPMEHVCYQCLLGETEAPLLAHFKSVALQRKGMRIVQEDGFYSTHQFAEYLRP